jgi:hypothetical protein
MKITFLKTREPDAYRREAEPESRYYAGRTYDLPDAVARHWLGRGVAMLASPGPAVVAEVARAASPEKVAIPDDWETGSADFVKTLAAAVSGQAPRTRADAEAIIQAEIAAREASPS